MSTPAGNVRLYDTLVKVLDSIRFEAPALNTIYRPPTGHADAIVQARSRALLDLFLKAGSVFGPRSSRHRWPR